jgi:hypothetical protein
MTSAARDSVHRGYHNVREPVKAADLAPAFRE